VTVGPGRRGTTLSAAGHALDVRGQGVVIDGSYVAVPGASMELLRKLSRAAGRVVSRSDLQASLPGSSEDGHATDVAIARLRAALGDARMVQTVVKRGYRLAVDEDRPRAAIAAEQLAGNRTR
jgi:uroporphyrinogen-III synthase